MAVVLVWHPVRVSAGAPPSGVVTFVFTDIEGSTPRWEADADCMRAALAAHKAIEAVDAAADAQKALKLPVRMGLATGETELRDAATSRSPARVNR